MSSNLTPRYTFGVGPEAHNIDKHLLDADGRLRAFDAVAEDIGSMQALLTLLEYRMRCVLEKPRTRGYPPRLFISYRRDTDESMEWTRALALGLQEKGYEVALDALAIERDAGPDDVTAFISQLATADAAIIVVTHGYLGQSGEDAIPVSTARDWLFEEFSRIQTLRSWGVLEIAWMIRSGEPRASEWLDMRETLDRIVDVRHSRDQLADALLAFPTYVGPRLTNEEQSLLASKAASVIAAARSSEIASARQHLSEIKDFANTEEFRLAAVLCAANSGDRQATLSTAHEALVSNPSLPTVVGIGEALWLADLDLDAVRPLAEAAEAPSLWRHQCHFILSAIFEDLGALETAANHAQWTLRAGAGNDRRNELGGFWSTPTEEANDLSRQRLARIGSVRSSQPRKTCESCSSTFSPDQPICVMCGLSAGSSTEESACLACGYPTMKILEMEFCPICRKGFAAGKWHRRNVQIVPREPGGRFSVLP
jgi:hypothetical protein